MCFEEFVLHYAVEEKRDMTHFVCDREGRIIVDVVLRFENFAEEVIPKLHELFGYDEIPHVNSSSANGVDFIAMYTRRSHEVVINRYRHCIDILNYHDIMT